MSSQSDEPAVNRPQVIAPKAAGFHMPAEWAPHVRCVMAWPTPTRAYWGEYYMLAAATYAAVARAIQRFEPVLMVARPGEAGAARSYCGAEIEVIELPIDDSWMRDSGPLFLLGPDGMLAAADFGFNSWGDKYLPYDDDALIGQRLCALLNVPRFTAPMVLEGGAITVDGDGTLITTESCLLHPSRNPGMSRQQMEQVLGDYLGLSKIIWLKAGRTEATDTDGHVDGVCSFIAPGSVLLYMVRDKAHPDYQSCLENRRRLDTVDARGRALNVVEFDYQTPTRVGHKRLTMTYMNSYQANGGLVVPTAGAVDDAAALERLAGVFPDRVVVGVPTPVVSYGGGGVHCITQQVPRSVA